MCTRCGEPSAEGVTSLTHFDQHCVIVDPHREGEEMLTGHYPDPLSQFIVNLLNVNHLQSLMYHNTMGSKG